jgi:hypothetical protein
MIRLFGRDDVQQRLENTCEALGEDMRSIKLVGVGLAATLAAAGPLTLNAWADGPQEVAQEALVEPAEEATEDAEDATALTLDSRRTRKHPGYVYRLKHLKNEIRRIHTKKNELAALPPTVSREKRLAHEKRKLRKVRERRHEVRMKFNEVRGR